MKHLKLILYIILFAVALNAIRAQSPDIRLTIPFSRVENLGQLDEYHNYYTYGAEIGIEGKWPVDIGLFYLNLKKHNSRFEAYRPCDFIMLEDCENPPVNHLFRMYLSHPFDLWDIYTDGKQSLKLNTNVGLVTNWNLNSHRNFWSIGLRSNIGLAYEINRFQFGFYPLNLEAFIGWYYDYPISNSQEGYYNNRFNSFLYFYNFRLGYYLFKD